MQLSTGSRYGLRAMVAIARHSGRPVTAGELASATGVSKKYLDAILRRLRAAGFITATRGARGGYALARDPEDVNAAQIVELLEPRLALVPCVDDPAACARSADCPTLPVWRAATEAVREVLAGLTLARLAAAAPNDAGAYQI